MRQLVLLIALAFIGLLIYLTAINIKRNGLSAAGIVALCVIAFLAIGIVGSLMRPPRE